MIGGREAFWKLRQFNRDLKSELDRPHAIDFGKIDREKDYFKDFLELKRLQREGRSFLAAAHSTKADRALKRKNDLINMLEISVNNIVGVLEGLRHRRVSKCFLDLKRRPIGINLWEKTLALKSISRGLDKMDGKRRNLLALNKELLGTIENQKSQPNFIQKYLEEKRLLENEIETSTFELDKLGKENIC
jgi:hypothetical protein